MVTIASLYWLSFKDAIFCEIFRLRVHLNFVGRPIHISRIRVEIVAFCLLELDSCIKFCTLLKKSIFY